MTGRAILFDALGTLLRLEPPAPLLVAELERRGVAVTEEEATRAIRAEIAYYRAHLHEAVDAAALDDLRDRCTAVLGAEFPAAARELPELRDVLLASLRFTPFPEVPGVLRALRARGVRLVVVSNWDVSLHEVLERTGLAALVDGALASAQVGAAKPDPAIFHRALELAGTPGALHVGDDLDADIAGARAAGLDAVLIARDGAPAPPGVRAITSLDALLSDEGRVIPPYKG